MLSPSLITSSGPPALDGGGAATRAGLVPTSIVPDSLLEFKLATASTCDAGEPSDANTVSEFGAAPIARVYDGADFVLIATLTVFDPSFLGGVYGG